MGETGVGIVIDSEGAVRPAVVRQALSTVLWRKIAQKWKLR
jgi:hypothetical protein